VTTGLVPAPPSPSERSPAALPLPVVNLLFAEIEIPVRLREGRQPLVDEGGRLWVYAARHDAEGFEHLQRYTLPPPM